MFGFRDVHDRLEVINYNYFTCTANDDIGRGVSGQDDSHENLKGMGMLKNQIMSSHRIIIIFFFKVHFIFTSCLARKTSKLYISPFGFHLTKEKNSPWLVISVARNLPF